VGERTRLPNHVAQILTAMWPDPGERERALAELSRYGAEPHEREPARVRLAILKLSGGQLARLAEMVVAAKRDYRDVLMWAEYPAEGQALWAVAPDLSADQRAELERLRTEDRHQYEEWLRRRGMAGAKIVVIYPTPKDVSAFERAYAQEHAPMVTPQNFKGLKKFVASKVVGTPDGTPAPFSRVAELHFPSLDALRAAAGSPSAQKVVAHAVSISTGGKPIVLVAEEDAKTF
jgi:uncharacterized protein (TIGR02118 family)